MGAPAFDQLAFRLRNDDGSITAATYMGTGNNQNQTIDWDAPFRIRFVLDEYNSKTALITPNLYINYNGGGWETIAACPEVDWATSAYVTDGTAITVEELGTTPSNGAFNDGEYDQNGTVGVWTLAAKGDYSEFEFCLTIDSAAATDGHTFQLRVYNGASALDLYTNEPTITVNAPAADVNVYPVAVAAGADSVNPTVQLGDVSVTPAVDAAGADSINPTTQLGDIALTPGVNVAGAGSIDPSVLQDSMDVTPAILSAGADSIDPTTQHGSINITPAVCAAGADSIDPTVTIGSPPINITPPALTSGADSVVGEVRQGPVTITPAVSVAGADSIDPTAHQGDLDITPAVVSVAVSTAPSKVSVGEIWRITHEAENLNEWDFELDPDADLFASTNAAIVGDYGLEIIIDDQADAWVYKTQGMPSSKEMGVRFYFDTNNLSMSSGNIFRFFLWRGTGDPFYIMVDLQFYYSASGYDVRCVARNDANTAEIDQTVNISDGVHYVEFFMRQAETDVSSDGYYAWWMDGDPKNTASGVDNYHALADIERFYIEIAGVDAGTSGTWYVDDIVARDDSQYIGSGPVDLTLDPVVSGADSVDPSVEQDSMNVTPAILSAGADSFLGETRQGDVSVTPGVTAAGADSVDPTVQISGGGTNVWPAAVAAGADTVGPTVRLGSVSVTPAVSASGADSVDPTVTISGGGTNVWPTEVSASSVSIDPIVRLGDIGNTPVVSSASVTIVAPSVTLSSVSVTPAVAAAGADSVDPTVQILGGGTQVFPAAVAAATSVVDPSIGLSSTSASPSASSVGTDTSVLTVRLGNVSITPAIDTAATESFHGETRLGSVFSLPVALSASVESIDPTVNIQENFINITPAPAVAGADSVDPIAHQGDLDLSPAVSQAAASAVLADVTQDSMDVSPAAGSAGTSVVDPLISISGGNFVAVSWARIRIPASGINVTPRPAFARTVSLGNVKVIIQTSSVIITVSAPTIDLTQVHVLTVTSGVIGITSDTVVLAQEHQLLVHRAVINVTAQTIQLGFPILYPLIKDGAVNSGISKDLEVNSAIIGVGNVTSRLIVEGEVNSRIEADLEITEKLEVPNGS